MAASSRTVSIQVPESASAGDTLTFVVDGKELEICLPAGCQPLDVLQVQLEAEVEGESLQETQDYGPTSSTETVGKTDDRKEEPTTKEVVSLANGQTLHFSLPEKQQVNSDSDGTCQMIWPLTRLILDKEKLWPWILKTEEAMTPQGFPFRRILELGAGTGCLGMALASNLTSLALSGDSNDEKISVEVTLTDCAAALPLLKSNLDRNRDEILKNQGNFHIEIKGEVLDWNDSTEGAAKTGNPEETDVRHEKYNLIVGSDLLYNVDQIPALVNTIGALLGDDKSSGTILLFVRWRKPDLERSFFSLTRDQCGVEWSLNPCSLLPCHLDWTQFGDSGCDASNQYFGRDLQISVDGSIPRALAEITEADTSRMTPTEYNAWELAHSQVYLGRIRSSTTTSKSKPRDLILGELLGGGSSEEESHQAKRQRLQRE